MSGGGAERVLINLLNSMDKTKYSIDLCLLKNINAYEGQLPSDIRVYSVISQNLLWKIVRFFQKILKQIFLISYFFNRKIHKKYDIVVCFLDGEYTFLLESFSLQTKKITWVHSSYKTNPSYKEIIGILGRDKMISLYRKLDYLVFVSNDVKQDFIDVFNIDNMNMEVVYNLIINDKIKTCLKEWKPRSFGEKLNLLAIGRLVPVKGFDRLIRVAYMLKEENYNFELQILGEGPEASNLEKIIKEYSLSSCVKLKGFQPNPYSFMLGSDVLVLSSIAEGLPTVVCEAFLFSLPVVSTRCTGATELLNEGEFGLIADQSDESLFACLKCLFDNKSLLDYYSNQSRKRSELFKESVILNRVDSILIK